MLQILACVILFYASFGQAYPYPVAPVIPPPVAPSVAPLSPTAYPLAPIPRPIIPGVSSYNPLVPGAGYRHHLAPGVAGYNPLVPGVPGYNPLIHGAGGYNNQYYNQYRTPGAAVPILTYSSEHVGDGTYSFSFSTGDGKQAQEAGFLKDAYIDNAGEPQGTQVVQGSYGYISPEGTPIQVNYVADENGFRPSGVHIPADGKATALPLISDKNKILDPLYNRYDPLHRRYNGMGVYNRPYDPRNPYEAAKYNPYFNRQYLAPALNNDTKDNKKSD